MKTFTEFYVTLMGFVNYRLYTSNGFFYPPMLNLKQKTTNDAEKIDDDAEEVEDEEDEEIEDNSDDFVAALNTPLMGKHLQQNTFAGEQEDLDNFDGDDNAPAAFGSSVLTFQQLQKLQQLFKGLKFFLNREVPRESLCFVIRSFGGEVSWDKISFPGATFDENDPKITHQIVDRDAVPSKQIGRFYVQPQWIFDCVNARKLLPVQDYFMGVKLPSHLSPFIEEKEGDYVPPEKLAMMGLGDEQKEDNEQEDDDDDEEEEEEKEDDKNNNKKQKLAKQAQNDEEEEPKTVVKRGQIVRRNVARDKQFADAEEKRLKVMSMPKKRKELYNRIVKSNKKQNRETEMLKLKRQSIDREARKNKKVKK